MADAMLRNPFPPASEAEWRAAAEKALKGGDFERKLISRTADGIAIQPLEKRRPGAAVIAGAAAGQRWRIAARVDHPQPEAAAELALADLAGGADALALVFHGSAGAHGFGLPTTDSAALDAALAGVELDLVSLRLEPAPQSRITARLFAEVIRQRRLTPADLDVDFGIDPIGLLARSGVLFAAWPDVAARLRDMLAEFGSEGFKGPFYSCDARIVHEAGGSEGQELGYLLAAAVAYLRALERPGVTVAAAERALSFMLAVDADQFISIAKLRSLRLLMGKVQEACGLEPAPIRIHAETARRMLTRLDVPVNMLRNAIAAFSAGIGGADSVTVLPHTNALGLGDGFARRIARNTQSVLLEESHLWRVVDPAAGAGSIEALTDGLCEAGWAEFQQIEREGGIIASAQAGALQARIAGMRAARMAAIATGRAPLTGTSAFPNLGEAPETALDVAPQPARPSCGDGALMAPALPSLRLSEPFEALRDRAEALASAGGKPAVYLATLGPRPQAGARLGFASGFFAAGGIASLGDDGHADADGSTDLIALTDAFKASGARLACLCGTDEAYAAEAVDAAMALAASGAAGIWLAGRAGEREAQLRAAGVGGFVFMGADMVAALGDALDCLAGI